MFKLDFMKRIILMCATILTALQLMAGEPISIRDITAGVFAAKRISGVNSLKGTSEYARISEDGRQVVKYSFVTGKPTGVIFDLAKAQGENLKSFDDYQVSADGNRLLLQTNTHRIYRRSFTADFYLYDVKTKLLKRLSKEGAEQIPTFSPDGTKIAFVHKNNIYITDGDKETQVTTDGEFNKVINGLPDWVNEEEFGFNNALAWGADSKTLSWIRYDESKVKTYFCSYSVALILNLMLIVFILENTVINIRRQAKIIQKCQFGHILWRVLLYVKSIYL